MQRYGLDFWSDDNFFIEDGVVKLNHLSSPSLYKIVSNIRKDGLKGPLLLRFPHLIKKQIDKIFSEFSRAFSELDYSGKFNAVYPLKVNQNPNLLNSILEASTSYEYGLEAGSKLSF